MKEKIEKILLENTSQSTNIIVDLILNEFQTHLSILEKEVSEMSDECDVCSDERFCPNRQGNGYRNVCKDCIDFNLFPESEDNFDNEEDNY